MSTCSSCGKPIRWVMTKTGSAMPADPEPLKVLVATGHVTRDNRGHDVAEFEVRTGFQSHFASCPFAGQHRKG